MDWSELGKLAFQVLIAVVGGLAAIWNYISRARKEDRKQFDEKLEKGLAERDQRLDHLEEKCEERDKRFAEMATVIAGLSAKLDTLPGQRDFLNLTGEVKHVAAKVDSIENMVERVNDFLMNRDKN